MSLSTFIKKIKSTRYPMQGSFLLGIDIGTSSVKVSALDLNTGSVIGSAASSEGETPILSPKPGWAEQDPNLWWSHAIAAIHKLQNTASIKPEDIKGIGISYQMHGLVALDADGKALRPSIIWCDSRAVAIGDEAQKKLGRYCLNNLLNSPGNFTASKLRWIQKNEKNIFAKIHKIMLPGDYIAYKLSGEMTTTVSGLSEGIFWDFKTQTISKKLLDYYEIKESLIPDLVPTFGEQGRVNGRASEETGIPKGTPLFFRAGDQPVNALSLNVLQAGEVAAIAGTSGVIYGVSKKILADKKSRINTFAHVNYTPKNESCGKLLCINGTGSMNSWVKRIAGNLSYEQLNEAAKATRPGADGLQILPFGNGAERMLNNKMIGAGIHHLDFNRHSIGHISRAAQEGIVYSLAYGFEILQETGLHPKVIRAGHANLFLSELFCDAVVHVTGVPLELYNTDCSQGAARGAAMGMAGINKAKEIFAGLKCVKTYKADKAKQKIYRSLFSDWKLLLTKQLK